MGIIDPTKPNIVSLNGNPVDVGHGLVDTTGKPLKKGDRLAYNKKRQQEIIRRNKDAKINEWVQSVIEAHLPKRQTSRVKTAKQADKLLDKHRINVITHKDGEQDFCCIVQGQLFGAPKMLSIMKWNWKK